MKCFKQILCWFLLSTSLSYSQVTKEVRFYTITDRIQQPTNFFPGNVLAGANISIATNSWGQITISGSAGGGTTILVRTNSVDLANSGTINFVSGVTGYVSLGTVFLGVSAAGGGGLGDVTNAQLLTVSNQLNVASNYLQGVSSAITNQFRNDITSISNQFKTDITILQGATNGLAAQILVVSNQLTVASNYFEVLSLAVTNRFRFDITAISNITVAITNQFRTDIASISNITDAITNRFRLDITSISNQFKLDITNLQGATNGLRTDVLNLQTATNNFTTTNANLANHINNVATNTIKYLTNIWGDVGRGFGGLANNQVLKYNSTSGTWTNGTDDTAAGTVVSNFVVTTHGQAFVTNILSIGQTNHVNAIAGIISLLPTNPIGNWAMTIDKDWKPRLTNIFSLTNVVAGQVMSIDNVSGNFVTWTNTTPSAGGGGLTTNANQFGASVTLTIKDGLLITNPVVTGTISLSNSSAGVAVTNSLSLGATNIAARMFPAWRDDRGRISVVQPSFMNNRIITFQPSATTVIGSYGLTIPVNLGGVTVSHPPPTEQWPYTVQLATPATSNACAGTFSSIDIATAGTRFGLNGYFFATEFLSTNQLAQAALTAPEGNRAFIGFTSTANPNLTNLVQTTNATGSYVGLYLDSGNSAGFFLSARDGTAGEFRTNTGLNFVATNLYQFYLHNAPTSKFINWKLDNLTAGTTAFGMFSNSVPTNMMKFGYVIRNGTTVVHSIRFSKMYLESPINP